MSLKHRACVEIVCDSGAGCDPFEDYDGGTPHFTDEAEARKYLDDWRWRDDGSVLCQLCAAAEDCAREGHQWTSLGSPGLSACERCNEWGPA